MQRTRMMAVSAKIERWPLAAPFRISGYTFEAVDLLLVELESDGHTGRGEAAGVYYRGDRPETMIKQVDSLRAQLEAGIDRERLQHLLPPGGARNAIDCALWDLEAKRSSRPAWQIAGLEPPKPIITTFTCGADDPDRMASVARGYEQARAIKLKLTGEPIDAQRVSAVRKARPEVWLGVDANQGYTTRADLEALMPALLDANVALIEQPFPIGAEALLDGFQCPIPIAADESVQGLSDVTGLVGRFNVVNIKLDKCGGLTEGLAMARRARALGLRVMVGNMISTSLAMAPAFLVGQLCDIVDLDGPIFLSADRIPAVAYRDGLIACSDALWGK